MTAASWRRRLPSSRRSLVARLVLTFLILSVVMVGIVGTVSYIRARDALRDSAFARLETAADQKADSLDRWVDEQRRSVVFTSGLLGGYYGHQNTTSAVRAGRASELLDDRASAAERRQARQSVVDTLEYVVSQTADAEEFLVLDLQGKVVASTAEQHEGVSQTTEAYFDRGGSGTYVQPVQTSNLTGEPTIAIGTPLFDPEGQRIGVVAAFLNLDRVDRIVVQGTGLGESGETYVVGANRRFLHSSLGATAGEAPSSTGINRALAGNDGRGLYDNYRGVPVISAYRWLPEIGGALVAEQSQSEAFAPARTLAFTIGGIGLVVVGLLGAAIYVASRRIARPILAITETASAVAAGDLSREAPVLTEDEVGELAGAFNDMTGQLRQSVETLERRVEERTAELADALEAQREAELKYRGLVEELPLAVYTDLPDTSGTTAGIPVYMSPRVEQIFGYPADDWLETGFFESVLHEEDRDLVLRPLADQISAGDDRWSIEFRVVAADGHIVWVRDDAWIVRDAHGEPTHLQGFMIDITAQKEAASEIARQKQYFESLVGISPVAVVTMDTEERVTGWNPAATRQFGYTPEEAIGRSIDELVFASEDMREEGLALAREALSTGRAYRVTQRARKDGSPLDVEIVMVPLVVDGEHSGFYAIYHDISELQEARRHADDANEAKSVFLASMSHEIRTPMNAVIGMSGLLLRTELDAEQRESAEIIRTSSEALLTIINDILDFSKIEAGRMELESAPFDFRACVDGVLALIGSLASAKGLELSSEIDDGVPQTIVGDVGRVRQILLNVLNNAVKFTEDGSIALTVTASPAEANGDIELHLTVRDSGIGISAEGLERLFQSFSQADVSINRRYGGTGLGLAISKRLAEAMGGTMWAESDGVAGQGSTFHVTFATRATADAAAGADTSPDSSELDPERATRHPLRILVAEDNAVNQKLALRLFSLMGYQADVAGNGIEALEAVERQPYDVVFMDVQMPEMDGLEATRRIRAALPDSPRIVAMTANAMDGDREACLEAGMDDYVSKPIRIEELVAALEKTPAAAG
jgi:PAS domain S-box-containing protein